MFDSNDFRNRMKNTDRVMKFSVAIAVGGSLLGLAFVGVVIWAIIKLVTHFL